MPITLKNLSGVLLSNLPDKDSKAMGQILTDLNAGNQLKKPNRGFWSKWLSAFTLAPSGVGSEAAESVTPQELKKTVKSKNLALLLTAVNSALELDQNMREALTKLRTELGAYFFARSLRKLLNDKLFKKRAEKPWLLSQIENFFQNPSSSLLAPLFQAAHQDAESIHRAIDDLLEKLPEDSKTAVMSDLHFAIQQMASLSPDGKDFFPASEQKYVAALQEALTPVVQALQIGDFVGTLGPSRRELADRIKRNARFQPLEEAEDPDILHNFFFPPQDGLWADGASQLMSSDNLTYIEAAINGRSADDPSKDLSWQELKDRVPTLKTQIRDEEARREEKEKRKQAESEAATLIQSVFRGVRGRKTATAIKKEKEKRQEEASSDPGAMLEVLSAKCAGKTDLLNLGNALQDVERIRQGDSPNGTDYLYILPLIKAVAQNDRDNILTAIATLREHQPAFLLDLYKVARQVNKPSLKIKRLITSLTPVAPLLWLKSPPKEQGNRALSALLEDALQDNVSQETVPGLMRQFVRSMSGLITITGEFSQKDLKERAEALEALKKQEKALRTKRLGQILVTLIHRIQSSDKIELGTLLSFIQGLREDLDQSGLALGIDKDRQDLKPILKQFEFMLRLYQATPSEKLRTYLANIIKRDSSSSFVNTPLDQFISALVEQSDSIDEALNHLMNASADSPDLILDLFQAVSIGTGNLPDNSREALLWSHAQQTLAPSFLAFLFRQIVPAEGDGGSLKENLCQASLREDLQGLPKDLRQFFEALSSGKEAKINTAIDALSQNHGSAVISFLLQAIQHISVGHPAISAQMRAGIEYARKRFPAVALATALAEQNADLHEIFQHSALISPQVDDEVAKALHGLFVSLSEQPNTPAQVAEIQRLCLQNNVDFFGIYTSVELLMKSNTPPLLTSLVERLEAALQAKGKAIRAQKYWASDLRRGESSANNALGVVAEKESSAVQTAFELLFAGEKLSVQQGVAQLQPLLIGSNPFVNINFPLRDGLSDAVIACRPTAWRALVMGHIPQREQADISQNELLALLTSVASVGLSGEAPKEEMVRGKLAALIMKADEGKRFKMISELIEAIKKIKAPNRPKAFDTLADLLQPYEMAVMLAGNLQGEKTEQDAFRRVLQWAMIHPNVPMMRLLSQGFEEEQSDPSIFYKNLIPLSQEALSSFVSTMKALPLESPMAARCKRLQAPAGTILMLKQLASSEIESAELDGMLQGCLVSSIEQKNKVLRRLIEAVAGNRASIAPFIEALWKANPQYVHELYQRAKAVQPSIDEMQRLTAELKPFAMLIEMQKYAQDPLEDKKLVKLLKNAAQPSVSSTSQAGMIQALVRLMVSDLGEETTGHRVSAIRKKLRQLQDSLGDQDSKVLLPFIESIQARDVDLFPFADGLGDDKLLSEELIFWQTALRLRDGSLRDLQALPGLLGRAFDPAQNDAAALALRSLMMVGLIGGEEAEIDAAINNFFAQTKGMPRLSIELLSSLSQLSELRDGELLITHARLASFDEKFKPRVLSAVFWNFARGRDWETMADTFFDTASGTAEEPYDTLRAFFEKLAIANNSEDLQGVIDNLAMQENGFKLIAALWRLVEHLKSAKKMKPVLAPVEASLRLCSTSRLQEAMLPLSIRTHVQDLHDELSALLQRAALSADSDDEQVKVLKALFDGVLRRQSSEALPGLIQACATAGIDLPLLYHYVAQAVQNEQDPKELLSTLQKNLVQPAFMRRAEEKIREQDSHYAGLLSDSVSLLWLDDLSKDILDVEKMPDYFPAVKDNLRLFYALLKDSSVWEDVSLKGVAERIAKRLQPTVLHSMFLAAIPEEGQDELRSYVVACNGSSISGMPSFEAMINQFCLGGKGDLRVIHQFLNGLAKDAELAKQFWAAVVRLHKRENIPPGLTQMAKFMRPVVTFVTLRDKVLADKKLQALCDAAAQTPPRGDKAKSLRFLCVADSEQQAAEIERQAQDLRGYLGDASFGTLLELAGDSFADSPLHTNLLMGQPKSSLTYGSTARIISGSLLPSVPPPPSTSDNSVDFLDYSSEDVDRSSPSKLNPFQQRLHREISAFQAVTDRYIQHRHARQFGRNPDGIRVTIGYASTLGNTLDRVLAGWDQENIRNPLAFIRKYCELYLMGLGVFQKARAARERVGVTNLGVFLTHLHRQLEGMEAELLNMMKESKFSLDKNIVVDQALSHFKGSKRKARQEQVSQLATAYLQAEHPDLIKGEDFSREASLISTKAADSSFSRSSSVSTLVGDDDDTMQPLPISMTSRGTQSGLFDSDARTDSRHQRSFEETLTYSRRKTDCHGAIMGLDEFSSGPASDAQEVVNYLIQSHREAELPDRYQDFSKPEGEGYLPDRQQTLVELSSLYFALLSSIQYVQKRYSDFKGKPTLLLKLANQALETLTLMSDLFQNLPQEDRVDLALPPGASHLKARFAYEGYNTLKKALGFTPGTRRQKSWQKLPKEITSAKQAKVLFDIDDKAFQDGLQNAGKVNEIRAFQHNQERLFSSRSPSHARAIPV